MISVNLIDEAVLAARRRKRRIQRWITAVTVTGLVAAIPVSVELSRHQQVQSLRRERSVLAADIETKRSELNKVSIEIRYLDAQMARTDAVRSKRPWSRLLGLIADTLPQEIWLVSVATDPPGSSRGYRDLTPDKQPTTTGKDDTAPRVVTMEAPRAMVLEGYALAHLNLYEFITRLKHTQRFRDVTMIRSFEEPVLSAKAVRFRIQCTW